jgi:hypothetical protein
VLIRTAYGTNNAETAKHHAKHIDYRSVGLVAA